MAVIDTLHEWQEAQWRLEKALGLGSLMAHTRAGACGHEVYVKLEFYSQGLVYETGEYETFEEAQMELLDALGIEFSAALPSMPTDGTWAPTIQLTDNSGEAQE